MRQITLVVLLISVFWTTTAIAEFIYPDRTPMVRFTGELLSLDKRNPGGLSTLTVFIQGKHWLFRLEKVEELRGRYGDRMILQSLFHRQVRFYGPENLTLPLQQPEIAGKLLTIEGCLYPKERRFLITEVEEAREVAFQKQKER